MILINFMSLLLPGILYFPSAFTILTYVRKLTHDDNYPNWDTYDGPIIAVLLYCLWGGAIFRNICKIIRERGDFVDTMGYICGAISIIIGIASIVIARRSIRNLNDAEKELEECRTTLEDVQLYRDTANIDIVANTVNEMTEIFVQLEDNEMWGRMK